MEQDNRVHFRKTLYFKMAVVTVFLGCVFFGGLAAIYRVSSRRFDQEITAQSEALTRQICRNVEASLKELGEKTAPLTVTNERLGPLLSGVRARGSGYDPYLRVRLRNNLEELVSMDSDVNWMAVVDRRDEVYLAYRLSAAVRFIPEQSDILSFCRAGWQELNNRPGTVVWAASAEPGGLILMRRIFDAETMRFCGFLVAEVRDTAIREIFTAGGTEATGAFVLCDAKGAVLVGTAAGTDEAGAAARPGLLETAYPIGDGRLKLVHTVDLGAKNRQFAELLLLILGIGLAVFLAVILFLWLTFGRMAQNLRVLLGNLRRVSDGEFELEPLRCSGGDELDILARSVAQTAVRLQGLIEQVARDKEQQQKNEYSLLETRYHELQAQVNPHFLFNTLQAISAAAQLNGDREVSRQICMLAKFFRGNIDRRRTYCLLGEELDHAANYLELCAGIYPGRLGAEWDVDPELRALWIPTYILQPLVENAVVHGMEPSLERCTVRISARRSGGKLQIRVRDDGAGIAPERLRQLRGDLGQSKRVGLRNVQERIRILYGEGFGIRIDSRQGRFTEVCLTLPLMR